MKINIIHHDQSHNMMTDAENLSYIFRRLKEKPTVSHVHINADDIKEATLNVFLENINMVHTSKAKYNIFIPNQQYFHKNWLDMCEVVDMILCKTQYCYDIFKEFVSEDKLVNIGWRSPESSNGSIEKDRSEWLVLYNDSYMNDLQKILDIWTIDHPNLNIVFTGGGPTKNLKRVNLPNIDYIEKIKPDEFSKVFSKCLIHLCLDETDCFNHNVNQCQLSKSIPVVTDKGPVSEVVCDEASFKVRSTRKRYREGMGSVYKYTKEDLEEVINTIIGTSDATLEIMGKNGRLHSERKQHIFVDRITKLFGEVFDKTKKIKFNRKETSDEEVPELSIVTPVHNLKDIFKVCVLNFTTSKYPKKKLEWVIVDDSDEGLDVEALLPSKDNRAKFNIKYIRLEEPTVMGEKLNIGVMNCSHECVVIMNQDDFVYERGFLNIVKLLISSESKCVGLTNLGCFDINKYISIINTSSPISKYSERLYLGGLCFYKDFWLASKFGEETEVIGPFLKHRLNEFSEITYMDNIVGLIHTRNSHLRRTDIKEPNGCHFNFSEKLFTYVCGLDEQAKLEKEVRIKEMEEIRRLAAEETEKSEEVVEEAVSKSENSKEIKEI
tara:strand:+ start:593 stop:2413 length:1821 start_codon:yes stop_codon:yes gene_type:complete